MEPPGVVRKLDSGYEIVFERRLHHAPERVWAMITDPSEIGKWYARTELEPRVGGRIVEHHDHVGFSMTGEVTRFEPPRVFEHAWSMGEGSERVSWSILWDLVEEGAGTRLVLRNRFGALDGAHGTLAGWHVCLDVMRDVLDGADPSAHAPPRGTFSDGRLVQTEPGRGRWADRERLEDEYRAYVAKLAP